MKRVQGRHVRKASAARRWLMACVAALLAGVAAVASATCAQTQPAPTGQLASLRETLDAGGWIARMHQASMRHDYSGTFVVLSANGTLTSARIWHVCEGQRQIERVEALSGKPRVIFRRDSEMRTFLPQERVVLSELRDAPVTFPRVPQASDVQPSQHYTVQVTGNDRVAGRDTDILAFIPRDGWRFGYRIWVDKASGLLVKMQTLDGERVLEQAAFSELAFEVPVLLEHMARQMDAMDGYRLVSVPTQQTTARAEGWQISEAVGGFVTQGCFKKNSYQRQSNKGRPVLQCIFSDGMATLSLFMEPYNAQQHPATARMISVGATQVAGQKVLGDTWVTAVGEVPQRTLRRFIEGLGRHP